MITDISGLVFNQSFNPKGEKNKGLIIGEFNEETKQFKPNDEIEFNKNFSISQKKFNTLPLNIKKNDEELEKEDKENEIQTRLWENNQLQATISRIMKSRIGRKTEHSWLVSEVAKQIDLFKPQPQQIKENIEKLIQKDIMP